MSNRLRKRRSLRSRVGRRGAGAAPRAGVVRDSAVHAGLTAKEKALVAAVPVAVAAKTWVAPRAGAAGEWAGPKAEAARDWVAPRVEHAVESAREDVLPKVSAAVTAALAASEPARTEAVSRGSAALAALKGEVSPPKQRHRGRTMLLVSSLLGGLAAGWWAWSNRSQEESWEYDRADAAATTPTGSTYGGSNTSPGGDTLAAGTTVGAAAAADTAGGSQGDPLSPVLAPEGDQPVADDAAAASPDEALADADSGTDPTVPTEPADAVVEVGADDETPPAAEGRTTP